MLPKCERSTSSSPKTLKLLTLHPSSEIQPSPNMRSPSNKNRNKKCPQKSPHGKPPLLACASLPLTPIWEQHETPNFKSRHFIKIAHLNRMQQHDHILAHPILLLLPFGTQKKAPPISALGISWILLQKVSFSTEWNDLSFASSKTIILRLPLRTQKLLLYVDSKAPWDYEQKVSFPIEWNDLEFATSKMTM
jgi:hypothetical protein